MGQGSEAAATTEPLEEVIVHARRRAEPVKDTPLAISVISGEQLREDSADTMQDVGRDVPNLRMVSSPQSVSALDVTMRGQTVNRSAIVFDSAVGLYVDGVYVANGQGAMATLLDIDSVEVTRGSQGTLSGRNNTGGSISLATHKPDLGADSIEVAASGGDYGEFMGRAIVNVPLGDTFAVRAAYQDNSRAGFGSSLGNDQNNLENQHRYTARFSALWKPGDATEAFFTYEHFAANEYGAVLHPLAGPAPGTEVAQLGQLFAQVPLAGLPTVQFPADLYQTDGSLPGFDDARTDASQLTMTHRFDGGLSTKLILGFRRLDASTALDVDASPIPFADITVYNTSNQKSAELQFADKALDGQLDWVGGLYWFRDNGSAPSLESPASPGFLAALGQLDGLLQLETGQNPNLVGEFDPYPRYEQNSVVNNSEAAYLHGEYKITPDWAVAAGARRTEDKREIQENDYLVIPGLGQACQLDLNGAPVNGPCPYINKVADFGYWSWELSSHYSLTPQWTAYARIGRSQRSGGWNAPLGSYDDAPYRPEQLTDYEIGTKAEQFNGALALNADVFFGQYEDMQRLLGVLENGTPDTLVVNAGNATVSGAEFDGHWRPTAHASVDASFSWTDAHYKNFMFAPIPGQPPENLAGNKFNESPPLQASLGASYEFVTAPGFLRFSADYAWQDKVEFNVINDFNYQGAYGTLNARVALASPSRSWEIAFYGTNLTNQHYAYNGGSITVPGGAGPPVVAWQIPGPMCMWVLEGTYRWSVAR
ncbi:MAG TPA: TonB-dependent receptor [Steroidobacteraceae bacterium]